MLQISGDWLEDMRAKHMAAPVMYARESDSIQVDATVGKTVFQVSRDYGVFERHEARDYILPAEALLALGGEPLPQRGDRIIEESGGRRHHYEVMAPGNEPCWRWSDLYRRTLRIHTKLIEVEDA